MYIVNLSYCHCQELDAIYILDTILSSSRRAKWLYPYDYLSTPMSSAGNDLVDICMCLCHQEPTEMKGPLTADEPKFSGGCTNITVARNQMPSKSPTMNSALKHCSCNQQEAAFIRVPSLSISDLNELPYLSLVLIWLS